MRRSENDCRETFAKDEIFERAIFSGNVTFQDKVIIHLSLFSLLSPPKNKKHSLDHHYLSVGTFPVRTVKSTPFVSFQHQVLNFVNSFFLLPSVLSDQGSDACIQCVHLFGPVKL